MLSILELVYLARVAPARERGLKLMIFILTFTLIGRSRKGAWIEMLSILELVYLARVAPARERGLKLMIFILTFTLIGRSRKGAWIEIPL